MMGVFDLKNKAFISCTYKNIQYVGCGIYLCEGFENGPGTKLEKLSFVPFSSMPERVRKEAERFGSKKQKAIRDKFGNLVKVELPKKTALIDVYIPEKTKNAYLRDQNRTKEASLPPDALLAVAGVDGMGVCDLQGNFLVEPDYPAVVIGSAGSGKVSGFQWDEAKNKLVQVQIPLPARSIALQTETKTQDLPEPMKKFMKA
jgi:hypothetical protein